MILGVAVAVFAAASQPKPAPKHESSIPSAELVDRIETQIVMPEGAGRLQDYDRSYTRLNMDGRDVIFGQLLDHRLSERVATDRGVPLPPAVRRVLVQEMMPVFDGGCMIVNVVYDVAGAAAPKARCNPPGPH